nr:DUF1015 domain-containing protein [Neglectibacter timonensis]
MRALAQIKPFRALRYQLEKAGRIEELTCPPYDIISETQRQAYLERNPYNVIRLELPRGDSPYEEAGKTLEEWLQEGILKQDMEEGLYLYEQEFLSQADHGDKKSLKGLICRVRVEDFAAGVVLPHEETLSKAKTDRFNLMKATNCNFSQIYSLYQDEGHITRSRIENLTKTCAPRYEFSDGLVTHRLWVVNDPVAVSALCEDFAGRKLYIADGHHRYETAINYRNWCRENDFYNPGSEYVMMMLADMADEGLVVFPTHRLVRDLPGFHGPELLKACEAEFDVLPCGDLPEAQSRLSPLYEEGRHAFALCGGSAGNLRALRAPAVMDSVLPEKSRASRLLDVSVLHSLILERCLGIDKENMANQRNLTYTRSAAEAVASVDSGESNCCFLLNPTRVSEIGAVAANGEKMPQKSTYFYPKLITGLVMNLLTEQ